LPYEEKWFPGVHSNVGGGYKDTGLSDISLGWMAIRAIHHGLNINMSLLGLKKNLEAKIENSQTWWYRLSTKIFVMFESKLGLGSEETKNLRCYIDRKTGDYNRPINLEKDPKDDISMPEEKINEDRSYQPKNILDEIERIQKKPSDRENCLAK